MRGKPGRLIVSAPDPELALRATALGRFKSLANVRFDAERRHQSFIR